MKKQLLMGSALFLVISAFSQSSYKPKPSGFINIKNLTQIKYGGNEGFSSVTSVKEVSSTSKKITAGGWSKFTSSMNIYGSVISYCKPLQWNDELNAVTYIHRKSPTYPSTGANSNTESGSIVAMISTDCGATWDSTLIYADLTHRGRYPQGGIYNPPGNTNINNAYVVANGPVTHGTGWVGNFYASRQLGTANYNSNLSSVPNAMQFFSATGPFPTNLDHHDFAAYGFSSTDNGKVRALGTIAKDINNVTQPGDSAVMIITGTFNNGAFDWEGTVIDPPTVKGSDGEWQHIPRPVMAWNELGDVGYVVIIGARELTTGSNVGFQPIVYKTTNSGSTWSLETGIDFNSTAFSDVKRSLISVDTDPNLQVPFFNWLEGIDCTVDKDNKLHVFSTVIGAGSNHPDSTGTISIFGTEGYKWPHTPGFRPYLYDFIYDGTNSTPAWTHVLVDSMSSEGPSGVSTGKGYEDNPWDKNPAEDNDKVRVDARLQMSRTPDGKYIVYTWSESDTTFTPFGNKWNSIPNVKARAMDVSTGLIIPIEAELTLSAGPDISTRAMCHFVSPKCKLVSEHANGKIGPVIDLPITVSTSDPYQQLSTNSHWYSCSNSDFTVLATGINQTLSNKVNSSYIYPNPTNSGASLNIDLINNSKVQIEVCNTMGQILKSSNTEGKAGANVIGIDLSGLASGVYLVSVKTDNVKSTKKLIIE